MKHTTHATKKYLLVGIFTLFCLSGVVLIFWYQDLRYSLPTPRPLWLHQKPLGSKILPADLKNYRGKPLLLHFFNPACPCSRFNTAHVLSLYRHYKDQVNFVAVVQSHSEEAAREGFERTGLEMPYLVDLNGKIADSCGVYSTPQAVLINAEEQLFYRGNYNVSRYCTDPQTEFARLAIDALLGGKPSPSFDAPAVTAYGCELPKNETTTDIFSALKF